MNNHLKQSQQHCASKPVARAIKKAIIYSTLALPVALPVVVRAQETTVKEVAQQTKQAIQLPASKLGSALNALAAKTGVVIYFDASLTQGKNAAGLNGDFTLDAALAQLLSGSGLKAVKEADGSYRVVDPSVGDGVMMFGAVKVSDSALINTTEGTKSYTTDSMNTATKLDLSIRETPQSVTVITRQSMDDQNMVDLVDVVESTPGLSVNRYGVGRPSFYSRGFSLDTITEDGITRSFSSYIPSPLSNLAMYDRAEIVRGSTGLAQGRGNPSAAVNLIRKRPTEEFQGYISASAGSWNNFSTMADISGAITDTGKIRARIVGYAGDSENFRDVEKADSQMLYGTIDFDLSDNTTVNLSYSSLDTFTNLVWGGIPLSSVGEHLNVPRSTFVGADWEHLKQDVKTVYASVEYSFNNEWNLRLNTKYSDSYTDLLGTWLRPDEENIGHSHGYWAGTSNTQQSSADIFVSGPISLFSHSHDMVFGVTTNDEKSNIVEYYGSRTGVLTTEVDPLMFNPNSVPTPPALDYNHPGRNPADISVSQDSLYSSVRWNLSDSVKLISGARVDSYENIGKWSSTKEDGHVTLYGGVIYDLNENHSLYASYTDIFKPQDNVDMNNNILKSVIGENYEVGMKGEYFDNRLNASVAIFRIDQTNLAKELPNQSLCLTYPDSSCYEAAGLVRSEGIDIELQGELFENWQVGAGYTYSSPEYVNDDDSSNIGKRLDTGIPKHLLKINSTYQLSGALNKWRVGGGLTYQSKIYYDIELDNGVSRNQQDDYVLVNLMVNYSPTDNVNIQANINNLFDETYYLAIADDVFWGASEMYGEPRNIGLKLSYSF